MHRFKQAGWVYFLIFFLAGGAFAQTFPFLAVKIGDPLPGITLSSMSGHPFSLSPLKKGVGVILFFGADSKIKKRHSVEALREIPFKLKAYGKRVKFVAIDAQGDQLDTIKAVAKAGGYQGPILLDTEKRAYKAFGVYVMPSVLIVKAGKIAAGFGYTHNLAALVAGEVEVALGLKTRQEMEAALHPLSQKMNNKEREARRYYNLGKTMLKRGMIPQAEAAFKKALTIHGSYAPAVLGMAEIAIRQNNITQAKAYLKKAKEVDPNALETVLVSAEILAAEKKIDKALAKILPLTLTHPSSEEINVLLGQFYEQKGDFKSAVKYYKRALNLCRCRE